MRQTTFAIGLVSLALAVSASALAQTSADTAGKKAPAVQTAESQAAITPASALEKLKKGNARFVEKNMRSRDWLAKVSATAGGQYPFAVILACMDSRAPIEIIFDQGIGDVFGIRIASNVVNEDVLGSMEYATKVVGSKLLVVTPADWLMKRAALRSVGAPGRPTVRSFSMKQYGGQLGTSVPKYSSKPRVVGPPGMGWEKTSRHTARCASVALVEICPPPPAWPPKPVKYFRCSSVIGQSRPRCHLPMHAVR